MQACSILEQIGGSMLMTAHHRDDQEETIIMKSIRGVHISNLVGMSWVTSLESEASDQSYRLLRPLLGVHKDELLAYLKQNGYQWRDDSSNAESKTSSSSPVFLPSSLRAFSLLL